MVETFQDLRRRTELLMECSPPSAQPGDAAELTQELVRAEVELEERRQELRRRELELQTAREQYQQLCELAPIGYVVLGPEGICESNDAAARLLEATVEELLGQDFASFVAEEDRAYFTGHEGAVLTSGEARGCELALVGRRGARSEVRLHSVRMNRSSSYLRMAILDVSDEKRLEKQLVDRTCYAELSPALRGLVHDLKHVLMTVVATTDRALTRTSDDATRQLMAETKRVALHGGTLIREALERPRTPEPADVTELNSAIDHMQPLMRQLAGAAVQVRFDLGALGASVSVSHAELVQLLSNLVVNARDAMPSGGELEITTRDATPVPLSRRRAEARDFVALLVSDTGSGMSQAAQAHAFEPYFTTKPRGQGTGLGLSTVFSIVKRAGGDVHIQSEPGKGTTVCLQLPRHGSAPARRRMNTPVPLPARSEPPPPGQDLAAPAERPLVLVAEDDLATLQAYEELLSLQGFQVVSASFASEALRLFAERPKSYLALLCDLDLRDMDGVELVRRLRAQRPDLPVIVVSGMMPAEPMVKEVLSLPDCELLMKPIEIAALATRLEQVRARAPAGAS